MLCPKGKSFIPEQPKLKQPISVAQPCYTTTILITTIMRAKSTRTLPLFSYGHSVTRVLKHCEILFSRKLLSPVILSFFITVFTVNTVKAQCTSKDVKIQRAFLAKEDGTPITQCSDVPYLWVEMFTKAPRVGALVQATVEIRNLDNTVYSTQPVSFCYMGALSSGTTFKFAQVPWVCGKLAVLKDVYIAWGTGQDPFCSSTTATPAPGTSSKCNQQVQGDQVIVIEIPDIDPAFTFEAGTCTNNNRTISFTATATGGTGDFTYSWDFGDGTTEGPNAGNTTSHAFVSDASYLVKLTVTDADPTVTPQVYTRTVNVATCCVPPSITGEFINSVSGLSTSATYGNVSKTLSVTATGDGLHFQWQRYNGSTWDNVGTDANSYTIPTDIGAGSYQYQVIVTGDCGSVIAGTAATSNTFTVTISKAALTITADAKSKNYDGLTYLGGGGTFTVQYAGFVNGDDEGDLGGTLAFTGTATTATAAATYTNQIIPGGLTSSNYTIGFVPGTLTINKVNLTITANDVHKNYGTALSSPITGTDPANFTSSGLQNGETIGSVTITYGTGKLATDGVATYADQVVPSVATGGTFVASNYTISYVKGAIIVDAVTLTIEANDKHKTYGTALSSPVTGATAFTSTGLKNGETIGSVTITYGNGKLATDAVGIYTDQVTPSAATGGTFNAANYNISYLKGDLVVDAATLTITATDKHKTYGAALSTPVTGSTDFNSSGLQNGETIGSVTIAYGNGRLATDPVATYSNQVTPSAATGGTFNAANYNIGYVKGAIIVDAASLTITATDKHKTYGTALSTPVTGSTAFTSLGLQNSETIGTVTISYGAAAAANTAAGTYNNQVTPSDASGGTFNISNYNVSYVKGAIIVDAAPACGTYNGDYFVNTTDPNGGSALVHLSVTITKDPLNAPGDINTSTLIFTIAEVGGQTTTAIGVLYSSTSTTATFTKDTTIGLTSTKLSKTFDVSWTIGGNYTNGRNCPETGTEVTVSAPANDFVTGGGYIVPVASGGTKGGANTNGYKNNFGFNVKWNKNFTNLQGSFNTIIRRSEPTDGNRIHTYQVKSNKPAALIVYAKTSTTPARALITYGNATIKDVTYVVNGVCTSTPANCFNDGNAIVTFEVVDFGLPSGINNKEDSVAIHVKDKSNVLWYSSDTYNSTANRTKLDSIVHGNIDIHTGGKAGNITTRDVQTQTTLAQVFEFKATPNPTRSYFNVQLPNATNSAVNLRVIDVLGRVVEAKQNLAAGQTLRIGSSYRPGVYIVEVTQGGAVQQLKLIKQ
jgi:hypothetical protein